MKLKHSIKDQLTKEEAVPVQVKARLTLTQSSYFQLYVPLSLDSGNTYEIFPCLHNNTESSVGSFLCHSRRYIPYIAKTDDTQWW